MECEIRPHMGLLDTFKNRGENRRDEPGEAVREQERSNGGRHALSDQEREELIEQTRSDLPELDRKLEENVDRLRELSKS